MTTDDPPRQGWDLVTSRRLTPEQAAIADELARVESRQAKGKGRREAAERARAVREDLRVDGD